jgi:orotidine-5'-phosphate decarboxylase
MCEVLATAMRLELMPPTNHFADSLAAAVKQRGNPVVVGLDPRWDSLPESFRATGDDGYVARAVAYSKFCRDVIDVVAGQVPAVKPQAAFFEELGPAGMAAMGEVIGHAHERGLLVIVDGKRNDIGSTAEAYARGYLGGESAWHADALTISPYLGDDSLTPFVDLASERGAGIFVLAKTSNTGSGMLQDIVADGKPIYRRVAEHVEKLARRTVGKCGYGCVGAVVGATYPQQLSELRAAMPHTWLLVPGFGSQGGTAKNVAGGFDVGGLGAIVNNSRGIIFAHSRPEYADRFGSLRWQEAVEAATHDMIGQLKAETPAGQLRKS